MAASRCARWHAHKYGKPVKEQNAGDKLDRYKEIPKVASLITYLGPPPHNVALKPCSSTGERYKSVLRQAFLKVVETLHR